MHGPLNVSYLSVLGANTSSRRRNISYEKELWLDELLNYRVAPHDGMDCVCNHRCEAIYHASAHFLFGQSTSLLNGGLQLK